MTANIMFIIQACDEDNAECEVKFMFLRLSQRASYSWLGREEICYMILLRWGRGHPRFFQNRSFDIFAYSEKIQEKNNFETNLSVIRLSRALRRAKIPNTVKNQKRANFPHFSKIPIILFCCRI